MADDFKKYKYEETSAIIDIPDGEDDLLGKSTLASMKKLKHQDESLVGKMQQQVTSLVWQQGKEQAHRALNLYANIDFLRPYFHVEPHELRARLIDSLTPHILIKSKPLVVGELYGPLMLVLTLIALLLFGMKTSGHVVKEGTLMGTAFAVCFGYWIGAASFISLLNYVCNTHLSFVQTLSLVGYALFGQCITLFLGTVFHNVHSHMFFYVIWLLCGGLSVLKMISVVLPRTSGAIQRLIMCGVVATLHLLFLLYLHFAYHKTVEVLDLM